MKKLIEAIDKMIADSTLQHQTLYAISQSEKEEQIDRLSALTKAVEIKDFCKKLAELKLIAQGESV